MSTQTPELQGYCPVAYHAVGKAVQGSSEFSSTYNGKTYWLVNAEVKAQFDANPEKYLPAYDGACAYGISHGERCEADPTNFKIIDGRTYLFLKNEQEDGLELWNQDEAACRADAERNAESCGVCSKQ